MIFKKLGVFLTSFLYFKNLIISYIIVKIVMKKVRGD